MNLQPYTPGAEGLFRMEAEDYHKAPGVSKHQLDKIAVSPLDLKLYMMHGQEPTHAMELGTVYHTATLEPHKLGEAYHVRPLEYINDKGQRKPWNSNAKACEAWLEAHSDKPVLKQSELHNLQNLGKSIRENPIAGPIIENLIPEVSMFACCEHTGLMKRGRADGIACDDSGSIVIVDLKFVADATETGFHSQYQDLRYWVQAAYYKDILERILTTQHGLQCPHVRFLFIAAEKEPMHEETDIHRVMVHEPEQADLDMGQNTYLRDLRVYQRCSELGEWPGNMDRIHRIGCSPWFRRRHAV